MLAGFPPDLSASAVRQLEGLGVTAMVDGMVVDIDADGVELKAPTARRGASARAPSCGQRASPRRASLGAWRRPPALRPTAPAA